MVDFPGGASAANVNSYVLGTQSIFSLAGLPTARQCSNGQRPIRITELGFWMAGRGGSRTVSVFVETPGGSRTTTGSFPLGSSGSAAAAFGLGISHFIADAVGQAVYVGINTDGDLYYGWNATSGLTIFTNIGSGVERNNASLAGYFNYIQCANQPTITSITPSSDGTSATVAYSAPSNNGGSSITGYNVQRATNPTFTTGVTTIARSASQMSALFTGLTPGVTYYFRVTARNAVTDQASVLGGTWSTIVSSVQPSPAGLGRQYRGGTWVDNKGKRWSGSAWQDAEGRQWSGSAWLPLGD